MIQDSLPALTSQVQLSLSSKYRALSEANSHSAQTSRERQWQTPRAVKNGDPVLRAACQTAAEKTVGQTSPFVFYMV